jgi:hypothetical protein
VVHRGALPVLRVVWAHGIERAEHQVLVVSIDEPIPALRDGVRAHETPIGDGHPPVR